MSTSKNLLRAKSGYKDQQQLSVIQTLQTSLNNCFPWMWCHHSYPWTTATVHFILLYIWHCMETQLTLQPLPTLHTLYATWRESKLGQSHPYHEIGHVSGNIFFPSQQKRILFCTQKWIAFITHFLNCHVLFLWMCSQHQKLRSIL